MNPSPFFRLVVLLCVLLPWPLSGADFAAERQRAEELYGQGSFAKARAVLLAISTNGLSPADARWLRFRLADTQWRAADTGNLPRIEEAAPDLAEMARLDAPRSARDRYWADANGSLAEFHRQRGDPDAWVADRFGGALDWWAGQTNRVVARREYLALVENWAGRSRGGVRPLWLPRGEQIPDAVLDHAVDLAETPEEIARFRLLRAVRFADRDGARSLGQVERDFAAARAAAVGTQWLDDVLIQEAQWRERSGRLVALPDGRWERRPDLVGALALYRRLVEEFKPGTSQFRVPAERRVQELTRPEVGLGLAGTFLPGSEVQFRLWARNVTEVALTLRSVELTRDVQFNDVRKGPYAWVDLLPTPTGPALRSWTEVLTPLGPHEQADKTVRMPEKLAPGAYLLEARAGGKVTRDVILVTDAVLVLQQIGGQTAAWLVDALTGRPIPEAPVKVGRYYQPGRNQWEWETQAKNTDGNGLALFDLANGEVVGLAGPPTRPAVTLLNAYWGEAATDAWKIFAVTDRPAYRPGDEVHWKILARQRVAGQYRTPAGRELHFAIEDSSGTTVTNGVLKLDAFGAAWSSLTLGARQQLGSYGIRFSEDAAGKSEVGRAELFRLEEYRLPEFEVTVTPPEETRADGVKRRKLFRPGDPLTAVIEAKYFFGAPVAGGTAEVSVNRGGFGWDWPEPREFPWLYGPTDPGGRGWNGGGEEVRRETLTLDAQGRATFTLATDPDAGDAQYTLSVSVTDSARRTQNGTATFNVTRQGYSVRGRPAHNLPRPGDAVRVEFRAQDANSQPVSVEGTVKVTRDFWWEVWLDSFGREVQGEDLKRRRAQSPVWPPVPEPGQRDWRLKSAGYRSDDLVTRSVKLGTNGVGELTFTPEREGFYRFAWSSPDIWSIPGAPIAITNLVRADATVWVTTSQTTDLGYHHGGLQIIVDQDTVRAGQKAPVMIVGPNPDRWVLFTVEGGGKPAPLVLHLANPTRLVEVDVTESLEPNFQLHAALVQDRQVFQETKELVVPPVRHFLTVSVESDQGEYRPGGEATVRVSTRDAEGRPVAAQVALAVVDESLFQIQSDLAGDPRQFFFGDRRGSRFQLSSGFNRQEYVRLVKGKGEVWYDDRFPPGEGSAEEGRGHAKSKGIREELLSSPLMERVVITGSLIPTDGLLSLSAASPARYAFAAADAAGSGAAGRAAATPAVVVRSDFRETALWQPSVLTDADGQARVTFKYPESTTRWETRAIAATTGSQFGEGRTNTVTKLPLMVRLQTPRFLVAGDEAVISALLDNNTDGPLTVTPTLAAEGVTVVGLFKDGQVLPGDAGPVTVPAGGGARVEWWVRAAQAGPAKLTATGQAPGLADAMAREFAVAEKGIEQLIARSGKAPAGDVAVKLDLPPRKPGSTRFSVTVTPSLAVTMLDALPYLADYPYGCTEQTLSRFLPAVIVRRTLAEVGLDAETAMNRTFGGISTNASGRVSPALGAKQDLGKLNDMIGAGLQRLYDGQDPMTGSWGWWPNGTGDAWMTAYVVWGLRLAQQAGVVVEETALNKAEEWLRQQLVTFENRPDDAAWALHALSTRRLQPGQPAPDRLELLAWEKVYAQRTQLNSGTRALLALSAVRFGRGNEAKVLIENLENGVVREDRPDTAVIYSGAVKGGATVPTAHWGERRSFRRWSDGGVEATAFAVRALLAVDPQNPLVEPAVTWLLQNRRGASWNNTRDTAITLLALTDYLRVTGELKQNLDAEITVNGHALTRLTLTPADLLRAPAVLDVPEDWLHDTNEVRIARRGGLASIYFGVQARFFTAAEKPIVPAGNELFVRREYYRLAPAMTLLQGVREERVLLGEGDPVASGDLVECRLVFEGKNDGEYLLLEDHKPAGFEATEVRSGWGVPAVRIGAAQAQAASGDPGSTAESEPLYFEWRDRKTAIFASRLGAGYWEIRYRYRAETPGRFTALPVLAGAMYVPDLRANSAEREVRVTVPAP